MFAIALSMFYVAGACPEEQLPTLTLPRWANGVQATGARFRKSETSGANDVAFTSMVEAFVADHHRQRIKFTAPIKDVKWRNGVASLYTQNELPRTKTTSRTPMRISRLEPIEILASQDEAAAIKPGMRLAFEGAMELQVGRYGAVGKAVGAQQLYTLSHSQLGVAKYVGTYTTVEYALKLNGKPLVGRWSKP